MNTRITLSKKYLAACVEFAVAEEEPHVLESGLGSGGLRQLGGEQLVHQLLEIKGEQFYTN